MNWRHLPLVVLASVLAACTTAPPATPQQPVFDAPAMVAAIRAAGAADQRELVIRSLGDPQVGDLQEDAVRQEAQGRYDEAADLIDQALAIQPGDPRLLQARAEIALLQHDLDAAERLARQAIAASAEVGPQCRRHWETVVQVLAVRAPAEAAPVAAETGHTDGDDALAAARAQRDACTVTAPPRY
ncbi:MAG TPA: tetratricopeptide repeat protein [Lysobacter sp.]|nr:tetratricopeptide repeat protein [Lysobacter sp.]